MNADKFLTVIDSSAGPDACWPWMGAREDRGYGKLSFLDKRNEYAHRASWQIHRGPIPPGLCVLHKCDNPPCCNPLHLFLGTKKDNAIDRELKGRGKRAAYEKQIRGEKQHKAKLTVHQVIEMRKLHASGKWTYKALGKRYLISGTNAKDVIARKTWKHVP